MWRISSSWLRRHAARAASDSISVRALDQRGGSSATLAVGSVMGVAVLGAFLAQQQHDANHVARMEGAAHGAAPNMRGPISKEHLKLSRRFTRRNQQKFHRYVIVGCGTAAHAAIEAIRQSDPQADILILSDERALTRHENHQYSSGSDDSSANGDAEPMSVALLETYNEWRRHIAQRLEEDPTDPSSPSSSNSSTTGSTAPLPPVTLLMRKDTKMHFDVEKNRILLTDGTEIWYEKCLIACSGRPRHFYVLDSDRISYSLKDRINTCTTLHDFEQLNTLSKRSDIKRVTVVGGGFLGTEVATAIATDPRNAHIRTQLTFAESAPVSRSLPPYLADELGRRLTAAGIDVIPDRLVTSVKCEGKSVEEDGVIIKALGNGKHKLVSDYVVLASTHTEPNLRLERQTCFEIDDRNGGIVVNGQLEAMAGVFVAGNAASYFDPYIGRRRVDRYDHAVNSGLLAGMNMVAAATATPFSPSTKMKLYRHQPLFRSNLDGIDVQIEGIGEIDASLRTVGVWVQKTSRHRRGGKQASATPASYDRGVVYYLKGNKIMGILLWNAGDVLESARQLLLSRPEMRDDAIEELKDVISLGPDDWLHVVAA
jgi:apoptosis-inducing factor 1